MKALLLAVFVSSFAYGGATITFSGASLAADGVTVTLSTNCTTACSPSTGITGFSVTDVHSNSYGVASATSSGTTITLNLTLAAPNNTDQTLYVSLSSGSNLTDSASNTAAGQSYVAATSNSSTWYSVGGSFLSFGRIQGGISVTSGIGWTQVSQWNSSDGFLEFNACASQINVETFQYNSHYVLNQDGTQIHDWGTGASSTTMAIMGAVTGLTGCHTYQIMQIESLNVPFSDQQVMAVQVVGTLGSQPALRPLVASMGDSLEQLGGVAAPTDSRVGHAYLSASVFGAVDQHPGLAGYSVYGKGGIASHAPSFLSNMGAAAPTVVILQGGSNDITAGVTLALFRTAWDTYITNAQGVSQPGANFVAVGIPAFASLTQTVTESYNAVISASAAANGISYVDTYMWLGASVGRQSDGHLNWGLPVTDLTKGENVFANRYIPIKAGYLLGYSYTTSGPTSGAVGSPSTNFTVTLAGGAIFEPDSDSVARETITLNDGGAGGTFVSSVGPSGIGPLAVSAALGTSWTFTYKPAIVTTATITFTSTPALGWKDPASFSFNSRASTLPASTMRGQATMRGVSVIR